MIEILTSDLLPVTDLTIPGLEAGTDSGVLQLALRNDTGQDLYDVLLVLQVEHPEQPGVFVSSGWPPQDELWGRVRLTGQDNAAAPSQALIRTVWTPIGAYAPLRIANLLAGGIRFFELKMRPPSSAAALNWRWSLATIENEHSRPVAPSATATHRGILTGLGDRSASHLVRGLEVSASGPPDDQVHVAGGAWVHLGGYHSAVATSPTLDQNDSAAAALAAGESYWAALTLGSGLTVTKGLKAAAPVKPEPPEGEALVAWVLIHYQAGGTSEISEADIVREPAFGRYFAMAGDGLKLLVSGGEALFAGSWRYASTVTEVDLAASSVNRVWQTSAGELVVTATDDAPDAAAFGPIWLAETDATEVIGLVDLRTYADDRVILQLGGELPVAPGIFASLLVAHDALAVEEIVYRLSDNGGGASGATTLDLLRNGGTFYTSQATDDQRPSWPFDSADLADGDGFHELVDLRRGDILELESAAHPTGGTPAWAQAYLICRKA